MGRSRLVAPARLGPACSRSSAQHASALAAGLVIVTMAAIGGLALLAAAAAAADPPPGLARLQGRFSLAGRVTDARRVSGEHRGQTFTRVWTFVATCPAGSCSTVALVRQRSGGNDLLLLRRSAPGVYAGSGTFYAPLRCGGRTYAHGASVPFTITVRVTAAILFGSAVFATRIDATYVNRTRTNLTPCVAFLGHDAAYFHGHLAPAAATPTPG